MRGYWTTALILALPGPAWSQVSFASGKDVAGGTVSGVSVMDAGRIDGDALADIVVIEGGKHAGGRKTFAWFRSPAVPSGTWTRHEINPGAPLRPFLGSAKLADFDNDGDLDLAVSSDMHSGGTKAADVYVFVNPGGAATTTWSYHRVTPSTLALHHINDMEVVDLDGDGRKDIVARSLEPNQVHIFFQNSLSSWTRRTLDTGIASSEGLSVGLIDGDARPDITFTGYWFRTPADARTGSYSKFPIDSGYKDVNQNTKEATGDINGDGLIDIVIGPAEAFRNGGNHVLAWYRNPGAGNYGSNWPRTVIRSGTNNHHTVKLADIDGDGDLDVVTGKPWSATGIPKESLIFYNNGSGGFGTVQVLVSGRGLYTGVVHDIGNDGDLDILGQDSYSGSSKPWLYESLLASAPAAPPAAPTGLSATAVSDVRIDLTWTDASADETGFRIERAIGTGSFSQIATVGANVTSYANTGLSASTEYRYRVRATNAAGNSAYSNTATATTLAPTALPPAPPSGLSAAAVSSSRIDLQWTDGSGDETGFKIERATETGSFSQIATVGANVTGYASAGLSASTDYRYRVRATNAAGNSSYSNTAGATTLAGSGSLPPPWQSQDVGAVAAAGSASVSGDTFTVTGSGADIWSTADEFRFVYQPLRGDGTVVARIASQGNTNGWAKAGPMIRESLAANSKHAVMAMTPLNGATFDRRTATGGTTSKTVVAATAPRWLRLTRSGDLLSGHVSADGSTWTAVGTVSVPMGADVLAGLAVTSHADGALSTAVFDSVSVTAGVVSQAFVAEAEPLLEDAALEASVDDGGSARCGATGAELLLLLGLLGFRRVRG